MKRSQVYCSRALIFVAVLSGVAAEAQNIITNPGFETGDTSGWAAAGSATIAASTAQAHSGSYSCLVSNRTDNSQGLAQDLIGDLIHGQGLQISAWVRLENQASAGLGIGVLQTDDAGSSLIGLGHGVLAYDNQWVEISGTFGLTVTGTLTQLDLLFFCGEEDTAINYYVDDVSATVVNAHRLTVATSGSGSLDIFPWMGGNDNYYAEGQEVTLTATPAPGWTFSRWEGDVSEWRTPYMFTMGADTSLTAVFRQYTAAPSAFYVASTGDDLNPGTLSEPFASPHRAKQAVRELVTQGLTGDVTVYLREGTYYLTEQWEFNQNDGGTAEYAVTYRSYPGEMARISGGVPVTGWTHYSGNIWQAPMPEGVEIYTGEAASFGYHPLVNRVTENGEPLVPARYPNVSDAPYEDFLQIESGGDYHFVYNPGDLDPAGWDLDDVYVCIFPEIAWSMSRTHLTSVDTGTRTVNSEKPMTNAHSNLTDDLVPGDHYFIQNCLQELDTPGECVVSSSGVIYAWPRGGPEALDSVVISDVNFLVFVAGEIPEVVQNLHFEELELADANDAIVSFYLNVENCSVRSCLIENSGHYGVYVFQNSHYNTIYGNHLRGLGGVPVHLMGKFGPCNNNVVENNLIHDSCWTKCGHAISVSDAANSRIAHNRIYNLPAGGIVVGGEGTPLESNATHDNLIAYNDIHHFMNWRNDSGGIKMNSPGYDNVVDHNKVHDHRQPSFLGLSNAIYHDAALGSASITFTNNIIYDCFRGQMHAGYIGNTVENNIIVVPSGVGGRKTAIDSKSSPEQVDITYRRNIFVLEDTEALPYAFENPLGSATPFYWHDDFFEECDYNLFWKPEGDLQVYGGFDDLDPHYISFAEWLTVGGGLFDQHSVVADPLFCDAANHNYHLQGAEKADSPALALGFVDIDDTEIGLLPDWMAREGDPMTDSDGDGIPNYWEIVDLDPDTPGLQNPFDPGEADSMGDDGSTEPDGIPDGLNDWDGDGVNNATEILYGSDPSDPEDTVQLPLGWGAGALVLLGLGAGLLRRRRK